jgi:predicted secreted protein
MGSFIGSAARSGKGVSLAVMIRLALAASAMSLLACNGCNHDGGAPPASSGGVASLGAPVTASAAAPASGETVVHVEDDGKSFEVARGSAVTFQLASNAGTGFVWMPAQVDPNVLAQQGDRTNELSSDVPGAPKMDVYHFVASNPGTVVVEMDLRRPWEHGGAPGRAIHVTVNVH